MSKPLAASRVKKRTDGRGGSLSYLETHDVIRTANEIFGFGQWGHEIIELRALPGITVHNKDGKAGVQVGYVCIVRLAVEGCVVTSGVGFGDAVEYRESAPVTAHELAAKEAESDALKRALKNFGDQFGLALYDKDAARSGHVAADPPKSEASQPPTPPPVTDDGPATLAAVETLTKLCNKLLDAKAITDKQYIAAVMKLGVKVEDDGTFGLTQAQAKNLIDRLRKLEKNHAFPIPDSAKAAA